MKYIKYVQIFCQEIKEVPFDQKPKIHIKPNKNQNQEENNS